MDGLLEELGLLDAAKPDAILSEDGVRENPDGTVTVELFYPPHVDGQELKEVTLRRINGEDRLALDAARKTIKGVALDNWLLVQLSGISPEACKAMDEADWETLKKAVDFLRVRRRRPTSGKPSSS